MASDRSPESATEAASVSSAESSAEGGPAALSQADAAARNEPAAAAPSPNAASAEPGSGAAADSGSASLPDPAPISTNPPDPAPVPAEQPDAAINAAAFASALDLASGAAFEPTAMDQSEDSTDGWTGRVLDDRYRIIRPLGEGGMGAVYVAEHLSLHKAVALKVVRAELAGNGEVAARFAREAMATAQFEHPHVASAIDYGTLPEGGAYFVMQLVRGRSLRQLISGGKRLQWRRACELIAQVADALSAAKAAGIIHRDLKPDNILVERREDGSDLVKVLDFGIAHVAPRDTATPADAQRHRELTRVGMVMGTPGYMSPEQAVGDKVDHRADLYALGIVLWECIAGRELWTGPDLTTVLTRQLTELVPRLRDVVPEPPLPPELDELVQRLTARTAAERPEHAAEVRDTLRRLSHASAPRLAAAGALAALLRLTPRVRQAIERYKAQPARSRWLQAVAAAAGLVLVLGLGAASLPKQQRESPSNPTTMLSKVVRVAQQAVDTVTLAPPAPPPAPPKATLPAELTEDVSKLLEGKTTRERRAAALKIRAYKPQERVFPYLLAIAALESARNCKARKEAIDDMKEQGDPRYLPSLRRLDRQPRSGCGFLSLADCLGCVREDLRDAVDTIEQAQVKPDSDTPQP